MFFSYLHSIFKLSYIRYSGDKALKSLPMHYKAPSNEPASIMTENKYL